MTNERITWTSRIGFVLASAGAAVGLGAIWKFPYLSLIHISEPTRPY